MTRAELRLGLAIALAALAFALGLSLGVAITPTVVRETTVYCDGGPPFTLETRIGLLERLR